MTVLSMSRSLCSSVRNSVCPAKSSPVVGSTYSNNLWSPPQASKKREKKGLPLLFVPHSASIAFSVESSKKLGLYSPGLSNCIEIVLSILQEFLSPLRDSWLGCPLCTKFSSLLLNLVGWFRLPQEKMRFRLQQVFHVQYLVRAWCMLGSSLG